MRVPFDELEFHKSLVDYVQVRYRGELFTGTAVEETPEEREEATFVAGEAHGDWNIYSPQGVLVSHRSYAHGLQHGEQHEWSEDGSRLKQLDLWEHGELVQREEWNEHGIRLVWFNRDARLTREWYESGTLKLEIEYGEASLGRGRFREYLRERKWDEQGVLVYEERKRE